MDKKDKDKDKNSSPKAIKNKYILSDDQIVKQNRKIITKKYVKQNSPTKPKTNINRNFNLTLKL